MASARQHWHDRRRLLSGMHLAITVAKAHDGIDVSYVNQWDKLAMRCNSFGAGFRYGLRHLDAMPLTKEKLIAA